MTEWGGANIKTPGPHVAESFVLGPGVQALEVCTRERVMGMVSPRLRPERTRIDMVALEGAMGFLGKLGSVMANVILERVERRYHEGDVIGSCTIATMGYTVDGNFCFEVDWSPNMSGAKQLANMVITIYKSTMDLSKKKKFINNLTDGFSEVLSWEWDHEELEGYNASGEDGEGEEEQEALQFALET